MSDCNESNACSSCGSADSCSQDEQQQHTTNLIKQKLESVGCTIMVMSGKGGVGKSTTTANIATSLSMRGYKVGIIDADIHGPNMPKMFGITQKGIMSTTEGIEPFQVTENLKVMSIGMLLKDDDDAVIWRSPVKHGLIQQFLSEVNWGELDFLLFDLPPGTGDEPLSVSHLVGKVDGSVIVTTPQDVALLDSRKSISFSRNIQVPVIGVVENMSGLACPHCGKIIDLFKSGGGEKAAAEMGENFLGKVILDPEVVASGDDGEPFVKRKPDSEFAKSFEKIADGIVEFSKKV